jgi:Leucine-rich repeat (LRR) protein
MDIIIENTRANAADLRALAYSAPFARGVLLRSCPELTDLEPLSRLGGLRELHVIDCRRVRSIEPVAPLKDLQVLHLTSCASIEDISPLRDLPNLRTLDLRGVQVADISPLFAMRWLQRVYISRSAGIPPEQLMHLTHMLRNCSVFEY